MLLADAVKKEKNKLAMRDGEGPATGARQHSMPSGSARLFARHLLMPLGQRPSSVDPPLGLPQALLTLTISQGGGAMISKERNGPGWLPAS